MNVFHCVFKVKDIEPTRKFLIDISGCEEGKSTENQIDFNFSAINYQHIQAAVFLKIITVAIRQELELFVT